MSRLLSRLTGACALLLTLSFSSQAVAQSDLELRLAFRMGEVIAVTSRILGDSRPVEELLNHCNQNNIGDNATIAILDQLGWAVAQGRDLGEVMGDLRGRASSGQRSCDLVENVALAYQGVSVGVDVGCLEAGADSF